jgi:hypothetical protein
MRRKYFMINKIQKVGMPNLEFCKIINVLKEVELKNKSFTLSEIINVKNLFPSKYNLII